MLGREVHRHHSDIACGGLLSGPVGLSPLAVYLPAGSIDPCPRVLRLMNHRTMRYTYWQEPHSTISRDGLQVMTSVSWDSTASTDAALSYIIGLPTGIYA